MVVVWPRRGGPRGKRRAPCAIVGGGPWGGAASQKRLVSDSSSTTAITVGQATPSLTGTLTSQAVSPLVSVVIVSAETGWTDTAKPVAREVIAKPGRDQRLFCARPCNSSSATSMTVLPYGSFAGRDIEAARGRRNPRFEEGVRPATPPAAPPSLRAPAASAGGS